MPRDWCTFDFGNKSFGLPNAVLAMPWVLRILFRWNFRSGCGRGGEPTTRSSPWRSCCSRRRSRSSSSTATSDNEKWFEILFTKNFFKIDLPTTFWVNTLRSLISFFDIMQQGKSHLRNNSVPYILLPINVWLKTFQICTEKEVFMRQCQIMHSHDMVIIKVEILPDVFFQWIRLQWELRGCCRRGRWRSRPSGWTSGCRSGSSCRSGWCWRTCQIQFSELISKSLDNSHIL